MQSAMGRLQRVNWAAVRRDSHNVFAKMLRTKNPADCDTSQEGRAPHRSRFSRCLTTLDLVSLGVGSCVGTGMYLVSGMVARRYSGPAVIFSFIIAALASLLSGACYAEFGVRVPNTTGSAYVYSYVSVGEFLAFVIGWNMLLEYLIATSACARALSACILSIFSGDSNIKYTSVNDNVNSTWQQTMHSNVNSNEYNTDGSPDFMAFFLTIMMMFVMLTGVKKSVFLNNLLNGANVAVWAFMMGAGAFYINFQNWDPFLPYGWTGVFSGAATCFYGFIGFDIIATTGAEANNPKRTIPLAIVCSLAIILFAYVTTSMMLTLIVPYNEIKQSSGLVQMFGYVNDSLCKYVVAFGALAGLVVSMFGSMFPLPRVMFAMAQDGLIFKALANISEKTGIPVMATLLGGFGAAIVSLFVELEILVEMMSIGTLLAYTLVSTCVLVLRYQPYVSNLIELLPPTLRNPVNAEGVNDAETSLSTGMSANHHIMIRRVTRSSPDSDESVVGDVSEDRDDTFLVNPITSENNFYAGAVPAGCAGNHTRCGRLCEAIQRRLQEYAYILPELFPWVDRSPATVESGMFVVKATVILYILIIIFNVLACYGSPGESTCVCVLMIQIAVAIFVDLLAISRKPQNHTFMMYMTPAVPFVPALAIFVNVYLIMNLSVLTLERFIIWMGFGMCMYFRYGIKHSTLGNTTHECTPTPPTVNPQNLVAVPSTTSSQTQPPRDCNIFEGDGSINFFGNNDPYKKVTIVQHETLCGKYVNKVNAATDTGIYRYVETSENNSTTIQPCDQSHWQFANFLGETQQDNLED